MITYYYRPLPEIPAELINYCSQHDYALSLKKKYIIAQLIGLNTQTDIDVLQLKIACYSNSISKSTVYLVLQWMIEHDLVCKTISNDQSKVLYNTNFNKLNKLTPYHTQLTGADEYVSMPAVY